MLMLAIGLATKRNFARPLRKRAASKQTLSDELRGVLLASTRLGSSCERGCCACRRRRRRGGESRRSAVVQRLVGVRTQRSDARRLDWAWGGLVRRNRLTRCGDRPPAPPNAFGQVLVAGDGVLHRWTKVRLAIADRESVAPKVSRGP